jgi:hypothetical protein
MMGWGRMGTRMMETLGVGRGHLINLIARLIHATRSSSKLTIADPTLGPVLGLVHCQMDNCCGLLRSQYSTAVLSSRFTFLSQYSMAVSSSRLAFLSQYSTAVSSSRLTFLS